ncbi:MAG: leucine-rich repeat protein [Clostridia bacterium]|nr:leucine-rich repeat protein [Clostridia bacterium]
MKRKLFLACLIAVMLVLVLGIYVSAEEISTPSYDRTYTIDNVSYPLWEQDSEGNYHPLIWYLNSDNEMCSVWADGQKNARGAYVELACSGTQLSKVTVRESNGATYESHSSFVLVNLNGVELTYQGTKYPVKYIRFSVFHTDTATNGSTSYYYNENSVLKVVFLPQTISQIGYHDGKVVQGAANTIFYSFSNCTALEYVEFHSNTVLNDNTLNRGGFTNCKSLKAISLPDSIKIFGNAALAGCTALEAVYLPSSLATLSSAGDPFVNSDNMYFVSSPFTMNSANDVPSKPELYYFPQELTSFGAAVLPSNVNKIVVISEKVTSHSTKMFALSGVETVVYLGNMTSFSLTKAQSTALNVLMPNTTNVPTVSATGNTNGSAVYLCKMGKSFVFDEGAWKDEAVHIEDPSKSFVSKEANCVDNAKKATTCFCGAYIGEVEIENSRDSEKHDLENAAVVNITYADFTKTGYKTLKCNKCDLGIKSGEAQPIFICSGYSTNADNSGIATGFYIDHDSLWEYESVNGKKITFGVVVFNPKYLDADTIFTSDGKINAAKGALQVELDLTYSHCNISVFGMSIDNAEHASLELVFAGYAYEGEDRENVQIFQKDYAGLSSSPMASKVTRGSDVLYTIKIQSVINPTQMTTGKEGLEEFK